MNCCLVCTTLRTGVNCCLACVQRCVLVLSVCILSCHEIIAGNGRVVEILGCICDGLMMFQLITL